MGKLLLWVGRLAGLFGVVLCAAAFVGRLTGTWFLGDFQIGTVLQGGIAAMVLGCLAYCANLAERSRR
jgi:hypothetical protein